MTFLLLAQVVVLQGATVHTMVPGQEPAIASIVIEDGRITEIGPDVEIPKKAEVVDLSGQHVFPGLIDGMVHHDMEHDPLYLLSGVTLCRDMGNDLGRILIAAMPNVRNQMPGPDLFVAGAIFDGVPPATTEAVIARNAAEVENKFERLVERGIQFASFHQGLPAEAWRQLIASAHEAEMQVWGPIPTAATQAEVLTSGQDGVAYLEGFQQTGDTWDAEVTQERVEAVGRSGIAVMPLLNVYGYRTKDQGEDPPIFNYFAPYYTDWWRSDLEGRRKLFTEEYVQRGQALYERLEDVVLRLWKGGVPLVPGSAAPNPWMIPGEGLHDELAAWVAAGVPSAEVLRLATAGAAEAIGVAADYGTLEVGKVGNAVVVASDPTEDLAVLRNPAGVLLRGQWLSSEYLGNLRAALLEAQQAATLRAAGPLEIPKPDLPDGRVVLEGRVEGYAYERVVAAEDYWVVRCYDGTTAWVARMILVGGIGQSGSQHTITQRFEDERLTGFDLEIINGEITYKVEGLHTGGQFRLKRWLNGQYVDTNSTPRRPGVVEAGMSLPAMLLSHYRPDGKCSALYFEGMDPVIADWEIGRREGGMLAVQTGKGPMVASFEPNGALSKLARVEGQSTVRYESARQTSFGGPGMPPRVLEASAPKGETDPEKVKD